MTTTVATTRGQAATPTITMTPRARIALAERRGSLIATGRLRTQRAVMVRTATAGIRDGTRCASCQAHRVLVIGLGDVDVRSHYWIDSITILDVILRCVQSRGCEGVEVFPNIPCIPQWIEAPLGRSGSQPELVDLPLAHELTPPPYVADGSPFIDRCTLRRSVFVFG